MERKKLMEIIKAVVFIVVAISTFMIAYNMGMENAFRIQEWVMEHCPCVNISEVSNIGVSIYYR